MSYINNTIKKILKWESHPFVGFDNITGADHFIVPNIIPASIRPSTRSSTTYALWPLSGIIDQTIFTFIPMLKKNFTANTGAGFRKM